MDNGRSAEQTEIVAFRCRVLTLSPRPIQITFQPVIDPWITSIHSTKLSVFVDLLLHLQSGLV